MLDPPCQRLISITLLRDGASSRLMEEKLIQGPIRAALPTPVGKHAQEKKKNDETVHNHVPAWIEVFPAEPERASGSNETQQSRAETFDPLI